MPEIASFDPHHHFAVGDELTIATVRADGTIGEPDALHPLKRWRVKAIFPTRVWLQPLTMTGEVDAFNDVCGEFWIGCD